MSRRPRGDRGSSALELAIIAPSFVFLVLFVIQASLWFYGRSAALSSAREGVSQLRLSQNVNVFNAATPGVKASVENFATSVASGALNNPVMLPPKYELAKGTVSVTVRGSTISLVPFLTLTVTQSATGRIELFGNNK